MIMGIIEPSYPARTIPYQYHTTERAGNLVFYFYLEPPYPSLQIQHESNMPNSMTVHVNTDRQPPITKQQDCAHTVHNSLDMQDERSCAECHSLVPLSLDKAIC